MLFSPASLLMISRPQPLGIFPYPTGLLLLPPVEEPEAVVAELARAQLMRGAPPMQWPTAWQAYAAAIDGDRDGALAALAHDTSALGAYNRFVLTGAADDLAQATSGGDDTLRTLTRLVAYIQGAVDTLPDAPALDGELRANLLLAHAAARLEAQDVPGALSALQDGIVASAAVSPVLAAQLVAQQASMGEPTADTEAQWRDALELAGDAALPGLIAELRCGLALVVHQRAESNRSRLMEAVQLYQSALQAGITRESHPELWAQIQTNLGIAYVSAPMTEAGDKLRLAVAVSSFREAMTVYTRETHPEAWASAMLNMANAMQYLPSSHTKENLIDAVNAYEELMTVRTRAVDPVGYARLLANQGNALAHLGMFQPAVEKLTEAHKLLHWYNEADAAARILDQLEAINQQISVTSG
jgi:tetratricopeptide (TPR) repeat protein